jgi:hypothetical protein
MLNEEVTINFGETKNFSADGLAVTFEAKNDSRCPLNVTCVWQGEARITLKVVKDGTEESLELKTEGLCQDETGPCGEVKELLGYRFELLFVYPYPQEGVAIEEGDYSVKIVVTAL